MRAIFHKFHREVSTIPPVSTNVDCCTCSFHFVLTSDWKYYLWTCRGTQKWLLYEKNSEDLSFFSRRSMISVIWPSVRFVLDFRAKMFIKFLWHPIFGESYFFFEIRYWPHFFCIYFRNCWSFQKIGIFMLSI